MASVSGSKIPTNGLICVLDAASPKSALHKKQSSNILQDPHLWVDNTTGGSTGYGSNGSTTEQLRAVINDDPWGGRSVIWRTTPDNVSGADGGWNTSSYAIDRLYTYRWSVWVRRHTAETGGTFYLGLNPAPIRNDNDAVQSNPYFTYPAISSLTQNQWYLVVGHCFYENYTGGRHPDSGWYENGVKIADKSYGNVGTQDVRWDPSTTSALHRAYHYYTTNINSGIEFAFPRLDKCDGTQPTIQELINVGESQWKDASKTGNNGSIRFGTNVTWSADNGGVFNFDAVIDGSYITVDGFDLSTNDNTVIVASRYSGASRGRVLTANSNNWLLGHHSDGAERYYANSWVRNVGTAGDLTWGIHVATHNYAGDLASYWKNGVKIVADSAAATNGPNGFSIGRYYGSNSQYSTAQVAYVAVYNRVLSDSEIINATKALRGRFGL